MHKIKKYHKFSFKNNKQCFILFSKSIQIGDPVA